MCKVIKKSYIRDRMKHPVLSIKMIMSFASLSGGGGGSGCLEGVFHDQGDNVEKYYY
jgi:hypothetical protein